MRNRHAFSLIELALALAITTTAAATAVPLLGHGRDIFAVRGASHELAGLIALTRATAIGTGGAILVLDLAAGVAFIETSDGRRTGESHEIAARHHVTLAADRASPLRIRYDALGVGRFAAASIQVRRGNARATVTISGYGRVRL